VGKCLKAILHLAGSDGDAERISIDGAGAGAEKSRPA